MHESSRHSRGSSYSAFSSDFSFFSVSFVPTPLQRCGLAVQLPAKASDGLSDSVFFFCGSAPRLSERRTSIFGLTSMSFVSNFGRQIFTVFLAAQRYLRDLVSKRYFRTNCIHSIRLRPNMSLRRQINRKICVPMWNRKTC